MHAAPSEGLVGSNANNAFSSVATERNAVSVADVAHNKHQMKPALQRTQRYFGLADCSTESEQIDHCSFDPQNPGFHGYSVFLLGSTSSGSVLRIPGTFSHLVAELGNLVDYIVSRFLTACWCD
jgi:hypothetical protein